MAPCGVSWGTGYQAAGALLCREGWTQLPCALPWEFSSLSDSDRRIRCLSPAPALHPTSSQHTEIGPPALSLLAHKPQAQGFLKP